MRVRNKYCEYENSFGKKEIGQICKHEHDIALNLNTYNSHVNKHKWGFSGH